MQWVEPAKPKLFLDFDSTIVDTNKAFCEYYNRYYSNREGFVPADHTTCEVWNFLDTCPLAEKDVNHIFGRKILFELLDPYKNAYQVLERLSHQYEIIIVSIGTFLNISEKSKWIKDYLPFIKESILLGKDSDVKMNKSTVNMQGGTFIDDVKSNLDSSNADRKILFGKTFDWNKDWEGEHLRSWLEIEEALQW